MKSSIRVRLMIPYGKEYREWKELSADEQSNFSANCVCRTGEVLNRYFGQNMAVYQKVCRT